MFDARFDSPPSRFDPLVRPFASRPAQRQSAILSVTYVSQGYELSLLPGSRRGYENPPDSMSVRPMPPLALVARRNYDIVNDAATYLGSGKSTSARDSKPGGGRGRLLCGFTRRAIYTRVEFNIGWGDFVAPGFIVRSAWRVKRDRFTTRHSRLVALSINPSSLQPGCATWGRPICILPVYYILT